MGIFDLLSAGANVGDDMARANAILLDRTKIDGYVRRLKQAARDPEALKVLRALLADDKLLSAPEVVEIAHQFVGGSRAKSRADALVAIGQVGVRLAHARAKAASAAKTRTW